MKMDFLTWFISVFCCYRITVIISRDVISSKIRDKITVLKCPYCTSVYVGVFTSFCLFLSGFEMPFSMWFILSLSFAGATIALDRVFTSDYAPK